MPLRFDADSGPAIYTKLSQAKLKHQICVREGNTWGREVFYFKFYNKIV